MAITIGDKTFRNLPEQVEENANNIQQIKDTISEMGNVMRYKGSVASYADLPTENNQVGDFYNVLDTGDNYAWDGEGWDQIASSVDLSNLVDLDSAQTLTGIKTFSNGFNTETIHSISNYFTFKATIGGAEVTLFTIEADKIYAPSNNTDLGSSTSKFKNLYLSGNIYSSTSIGLCPSNLTYSVLQLSSSEIYTRAKIRPANNNSYDLGDPTHYWKDLYLAGQVIGASNVFNVIKASDIVSNTLTQDQYDLITNGKPTLISGVLFSPIENILLMGVGQASFGEFDILGICSYATAPMLRCFTINTTSKVISMVSETSKRMRLQSISILNGKNIPDYPANTGTFVLKCIDGVLTWVQE